MSGDKDNPYGEPSNPYGDPPNPYGDSPNPTRKRAPEVREAREGVIRCPTPGCEDNELFEISITVYSDRDVAENLMKIPAEQFKCSNCGSRAVLK